MKRTITAMVLAVVATLLTSGCSTIHDQLDGAGAPDDPRSTPATPGPILQTMSWGVVDGMLSVVVRNTTDQTLRYAVGVITARTADDRLVAISLEYGDANCCQVQQLRPGQKYGFYVDVGRDQGEKIARVDVAYRNVAWDQDRSQVDRSRVVARPTRLRETDRGTVVLADVSSRYPEPLVVAQAFLTDTSGRLVAVVSGHWRCVRPGRQQLKMQLFHPVPAGTRVHEVHVHPVDDDPTRPAPKCASAGKPGGKPSGKPSGEPSSKPSGNPTGQPSARSSGSLAPEEPSSGSSPSVEPSSKPSSSAR